MTTHWTIYSREYDLGRINHPDPNSLWRDLRAKHWTAASWKSSGTSFAHVRPIRTGFTVRLFRTLAAANRFHKTLSPLHPS